MIWPVIKGLGNSFQQKILKLPVFGKRQRKGSHKNFENCCTNIDKVFLELDDYLEIKLTRMLTYDTPHEVTIVIPRVEIRHEHVKPTGEKTSSEILMNSITVVHSPQRPSHEGDGPSSEIATRTIKAIPAKQKNSGCSFK